jgi:hypothetical protein
MKLRLAIIACALACVATAELVPELLTAAFYRTNVVASVKASTYYKGSTVRLTNCVAYASGGTTQNLSGITVTVRIGDSATNLQTTCTAYDLGAGKFCADANIPRAGGSAMRVQVTLYTNGVTYIYPDLPITVESPL